MNKILQPVFAFALLLPLPLPAVAQVSTAPSQNEEVAALWTRKQADFLEFKHNLLRLVAAFDRTEMDQGAIEAFLGVQFVPSSTAESFLAPASPNKRLATTFKSLNVEQYILPSPNLGKNDPGNQIPTDSYVRYGLQGTELSIFGTTFNNGRLGIDLDNCISLHELKSHFGSEASWQYAQSSMFYPGLASKRDGAVIVAFIWPDTFKSLMTPREKTEFDRMSEDAALERSSIKLQRLNELKAKIDGCVFMLELR